MNREKEELKEILCSLIRTAPNILSKKIVSSVADICKAIENYYIGPQNVVVDCHVENRREEHPMLLILCPNCQGSVWVVIIWEMLGKKVGLFCLKCGEQNPLALTKQKGEHNP